MLVREFIEKGGAPLFLCPPGLTPEFTLYDMLEDGTKRYLVNLVPYYPCCVKPDEDETPHPI